MWVRILLVAPFMRITTYLENHSDTSKSEVTLSLQSESQSDEILLEGLHRIFEKQGIRSIVDRQWNVQSLKVYPK